MKKKQVIADDLQLLHAFLGVETRGRRLNIQFYRTYTMFQKQSKLFLS